MITLDKALRLYTDQINAREKIDVQFYKANLTPEDFNEFVELSDFISLLKSKSDNESFQRAFAKVDSHKRNNWSLTGVSGFRADLDSDKESAKSRLDQIFDEEFLDE